MAKTISASVGRMGGVNRPDDVTTVQELLNQVPTNSGGAAPPLRPDGLCGNKTIRAIQEFQLHHFGWSGADGKVNPDGETLRKLNEFDTGVTSTRPTSINFQIRLVEMDLPRVVGRPPLDRRNLFLQKVFQIVDLANALTAFYLQGEDTLRRVRSHFRLLRIVRRARFSPFVTPEAVSATSFAGECITHSIVTRPGRTTVRLFLPRIEGQLVNLSLFFEGFRDDATVGTRSSNALPLGLIEPTARPFAANQ